MLTDIHMHSARITVIMRGTSCERAHGQHDTVRQDCLQISTMYTLARVLADIAIACISSCHHLAAVVVLHCDVQMLTVTRGTGVMDTLFDSYR